MKKLIVLVYMAVALISIGCYDNAEKATIRINLGNIPIAKQSEQKSLFDRIFSLFIKDAYAQTTADDPYYIDILHIAIYSGDTVIANESINGTDVAVDGNSNSYIELTVPEGDVTVLVVGEYNSDGIFANYIGSEKVKLNPGNNDVNVMMKNSSSWSSGLNISSVADTGTISWNSLGIPLKYQIKDQSGNIVYEGTGTQADSLVGGCNGYLFEMYLVFDLFGISTNYVDTVLVYDSNQC